MVINDLEGTDIYRSRSLDFIYTLACDKITIGCEVDRSVGSEEVLRRRDLIPYGLGIGRSSALDGTCDDVCSIVGVRSE